MNAAILSVTASLAALIPTCIASETPGASLGRLEPGDVLLVSYMSYDPEGTEGCFVFRATQDGVTVLPFMPNYEQPQRVTPQEIADIDLEIALAREGRNGVCADQLLLTLDQYRDGRLLSAEAIEDSGCLHTHDLDSPLAQIARVGCD